MTLSIVLYLIAIYRELNFTTLIIALSWSKHRETQKQHLREELVAFGLPFSLLQNFYISFISVYPVNTHKVKIPKRTYTHQSHFHEIVFLLIHDHQLNTPTPTPKG